MMTFIWVLLAVYVAGVFWFYATELAYIRYGWIARGPGRLGALRYALRWPWEVCTDWKYAWDNLTARYGFRL